MRDITYKQTTKRLARAIGYVWCSENTWTLVKEQKTPKGNVFDYARAAGFIGAKQTSSLIPHCHPVSIDGLSIDFELIQPGDPLLESDAQSTRFGIRIIAEALTIGRTGIEIEALSSVSVTALTVYDLLKNLADPTLVISGIRLLEKRGGKSDRDRLSSSKMRAATLIYSDDIYNGHRQSDLFDLVRTELEEHNTSLDHTEVLPMKPQALRNALDLLVSEEMPYVFVAGGTGIRPKDQTIEVLEDYCERSLPGVAEAMRSFGQVRTPLAMLSRTFAGVKNNTVIVSIPGSTKGAQESLQAIMPGLLKAHWMLKKIDRSDA